MEPELRKRKVDWLLRYQESLRRERRLQEQIRRVESRAESTTQALTGMPGGGATGSKVENGAILLAAYRMDLIQQLAESEKIRAEIEMAIGQIAEETEREVLIWRYIIGDYGNRLMDFWKVGNRLHISERHVKRLHNSALEHLKDVPPCPVCDAKMSMLDLET